MVKSLDVSISRSISRSVTLLSVTVPVPTTAKNLVFFTYTLFPLKTCFNIGGQRSQLAEKHQWTRVSHESGKAKTTFEIVYNL